MCIRDQRTPALCGDALGPVVVEHRSLGEVRVQLDLVDRGQDAGLGFETVDLRGGEVRDPDGANQALALEPDHGAPRLDVPVDARKRPVYEVQVDVLQAQANPGCSKDTSV